MYDHLTTSHVRVAPFDDPGHTSLHFFVLSSSKSVSAVLAQLDV
jgi:hypothetical protein